MRERKSSQFIGIIFMALGIMLVLKAILGFGSLILFDGWWAAIIVAWAAYNIYKEGMQQKYLITGIVGLLLFINCRTHFLGFLCSKLFFPILLVAIGVRILTKNR